jgi:dipeptidyl aminopeptidase/acylaminoacyl peptidase
MKPRHAAGLVAVLVALLGAPAHGDVTSPAPAAIVPSWSTPPEKLVLPPASATVAPDGLRAAWTTDDHKSVLSATRAAPSAEWAAPDRLFTTRGTVGSLVFSPDGRSIAYENTRTWRDDGTADDTWAFIGVYDLQTRQISYVDPSFDIDSHPSWSADGRAVSFTRHVEGLPDTALTRPVTRLRLAAWQPPAQQPGERFTMASVVAAPFIYPPVPSADGKSLAYLTREARDRNVYFLRLGQAARRIATYPDDDGRDLSDVAVSNSGGAVAYVRGASVNRQGDSPNPTSVADMPQRQVWIVGTDGDMPRLLGAGRDPMFAPDDSRVLWREHGAIWAAMLQWSGHRLVGVGEPREFLTGTRSGLRFSPDGTKVAYERGSAIEIHDFASHVSVVIPHGNDTDLGPVWSPDGKRLVFRREPSDSPGLERNICGGGERYCGPMLSTQPWALMVVDAANPQPRKVWQAHAGVGSVYYPLDQDYAAGEHGGQLFWSADDRIGFVWEADGWRHLYSVPVAGGDAIRLTDGDGEVEAAALSLDRTRIVYATNIGDLGRRHLASVRLDGGPAQSLTGGEKSQWAPTPLAGGRIAYIAAGWADPPQVRVRSSNGSTQAAGLPRIPASFPGPLLVKPQLVEFPASDGQVAFGQLFVPEHANGCAIVFSHGGIKRQMLPGFHYMDAYQYLYEMNQYLAGRGCVVLSVEYRSSIMRGEAFRDAPGWGFSGNSEIRDFVGAAHYLLARPDVDPRRGVGIYGLSWGGYMTAEALALHSDLYTVGFDMAGVHETADPAGKEFSAMSQLEGWKSPVYLVQGDDDMNVDFNDGTVLARAMQRKKPEVELRQEAVPGQTHDLYQTYEQLVETYTKGSEFLIRHLGPR